MRARLRSDRRKIIIMLKRRFLTALAVSVAITGAAMAHDTGSGESWQLGDLTITGPFSRATLPNAPVAGGFLTVTNGGAEEDRLVAAASDAASHVEIHEMAVEGDVMKMRQLPDGLPIPAGETVELRPGGLHLMFMQLRHPLVEGETVDVTLTFEKAGEIELPLAIGPINSRAAGHGKAGDDMHKGH